VPFDLVKFVTIRRSAYVLLLLLLFPLSPLAMFPVEMVDQVVLDAAQRVAEALGLLAPTQTMLLQDKENAIELATGVLELLVR